MRRLADIMRAFLALVLAVACLWSVALAVPPVDADAAVSLAVEFHMDGTSIPGGRFDLFSVGSMDAGGVVSLLPEYAADYSLSESTDRKGWARLAREMAADIEANGVAPQETVVTDEDGLASFGVTDELGQGVYLVVGHDTKVGDTTYVSLPYLISLPLWDDETESWVYDVLSEPKVSKKTEGEPGPTPEPTPEPTPTPGPTPTPEPTTPTTTPTNTTTTTSTTTTTPTTSPRDGGSTATTSIIPSWFPKTGEELSYWLAYLVAGCALVEIGLTIRRMRREP